MASESRTAVYVGIVATLLIAGTKFAAAWFSGSSAMVAEGIHSLVDSADGFLLLLGHHRAAKPPDEEHPLGHGKELYFWSLIVAILFFALGGGMSIYEGIHHLMAPEPVADPTWNYAVLGASAVFTLGSFAVAFRQFRATSPRSQLLEDLPRQQGSDALHPGAGGSRGPDRPAGRLPRNLSRPPAEQSVLRRRGVDRRRPRARHGGDPARAGKQGAAGRRGRRTGAAAGHCARRASAPGILDVRRPLTHVLRPRDVARGDGRRVRA